MNGSYGAFATSYFILYNNHVAGTITAQGRDLTKKMDSVNEDYWYDQWHQDHDLHRKLCIQNITPLNKGEHVSIYADTDSLFVSFKPAIDHSDWNNLIFNTDYLNSIQKKFIIFSKDTQNISNINCLGVATNITDFERLLAFEPQQILIDGYFVKDRELIKIINKFDLTELIKWNWSRVYSGNRPLSIW